MAAGCEGQPGVSPWLAEEDIVVRISGDPQCDGCEIVLREVGSFGDPSDPSSIRDDAEGRQCMVGRLRSGEFLMSGPVGGGEIFVYDTAGRFHGSIGRRGAGPAEFDTDLRVIVGPEDTLYVMDDSHRRIQVLTPEGTYVRSFPAPWSHQSMSRLTDGSFLFFRPPAERRDRLFHLTDAEGRVLTEFGSPSMANPGVESWKVTAGWPDGFWTAPVLRYELYRWQPPDSLELAVVREVGWFPPFPSDGEYPTREQRQREPYPPMVGHLHQDRSGLVWSYTWIPGRSWEPDIPTRPQYEWARRTFDTMVEVIDVERAEVLAQLRFDGRLGPFCGEHLLYTITEDPEGYPYVRVLEPILRRSDG